MVTLHLPDKTQGNLVPSDHFLDYKASGIAAVLRTESLAVPAYQRSYSWSSTEEDDDETREARQPVAEFWNDLSNSYRLDQSYFLGTIVLSNEGAEESRKAVLDGQQRLATTSVLMAAIRDQFDSRGESADARSIQDDYVGKWDRVAGELRPRIVLNTDDREFFRQAVLNRDVGFSATSRSQERIREAYLFLAAQVQQFADDTGARWKEELLRLVKYVDDRVQVIAITVADESDAFLIFETLNDRGADLTIADLLKNYLFSRAGARLDEVRDAWMRTLSNLDIPKVGNARFTLFARHFMSMRHGVVRERELYSRIKSEANDPNSSVEFANQLDRLSRFYYALLTADSDVWSNYPDNVRQAAEVIVELNLERYRPLLLAALSKFSSSEVQRLVKAIVSWSIRGLAGGRFNGGVAEAAFCTVAKEIAEGRITTADEVLADSRMDSLIPSDVEFARDFAQWRLNKGSLARYVLRSLELAERGELEPELVVNPDVDQVNLEHVLPKSPRSIDWPQFAPEEQKLYVDRIGNLALLQKGPNGRIGNKAWADKKPVLKASTLKLTSSIADYADWSKEAIVDRQDKFAQKAIIIWPKSLPPT